ncbi:MAG: hypothetical protein K0R66_1037 [Gammaproteobacteria bacterium]|nr:hypothetical protein [Gammaproteobacteria bacterium]
MPGTNRLETLPKGLSTQISSYLSSLDKVRLSGVSKHQKRSIRLSEEEIQNLPQELLIQISSYLSSLDKVKLSCVSVRHRQSTRLTGEERQLARDLPSLIRGQLPVNQIQLLMKEPKARREIELHASRIRAAYSISDLQAIQLSDPQLQQELSIRSQNLRRHSISYRVRCGILALAIGLGLLIAGLAKQNTFMSISGVTGLIIGLISLISGICHHRNPASAYALAASFTSNRDRYRFSDARRHESALALHTLHTLDRELQINPGLNQPPHIFWSIGYATLQRNAAQAGDLSQYQQALLDPANAV